MGFISVNAIGLKCKGIAVGNQKLAQLFGKHG
jgi:hypothetical protein